MGHLVFFEGTDSISAIDYAEEYYGADSDTELVGCSVPATEHSVMCMGGKETELETFRRLIKLHPEGVLAIVSDTWDFWKVITEFAAELRDEIEARQPNALGLAKVVFRPDSGNPVDILCGIEVRKLDTEYSSPCNFDEWKERVAEEMDNQFCNNLDAEDPHCNETEFWSHNGEVYEVVYEPDLNRHDKTYYYVDNCGDDVSKCTFTEVVLTPEQKGAVQCLYETFGGDVTDAGYLVLNERVGLIYGDSITLERCEAICQRLMDKGFATGNVVFGVGSYTYQYVTRDTIGGAMKATYGIVNGEGIEIYKDPKTDSGEKKSAKGLLVVEEVDGPSDTRFKLKDQATWEQVYGKDNAMRVVYRNGRLTEFDNLATIRNLARA
jgi:nicotinamide phosphoribosyltransferase